MLELVRLRASQINGCACCIDMHTKDARAEGETEQRLYATSAWEETPFFTDRERAALAWTESVTSIAWKHAPDEALPGRTPAIYREGTGGLDDGHHRDQRLEPPGIPFRAVPGTYQAPVKK